MAMFDNDTSVSSAAPVNYPFPEAEPGPDYLDSFAPTAAYEIAAPGSLDSFAAEESPLAEESAASPAPPAGLPTPALHSVFITAADFADMVPPTVTWLAGPWVAAGAVTLLDGKAKSGKTSFLSQLVSAVSTGGPFLGRPTTKTRVVYATEEGETTFRQTLARAGLETSHDVIILTHRAVATEPWAKVASLIAQTCADTGARLVVIDTLAKFVPEAEGSSAKALAAMAELHQLKELGVGVVVTRHQRKAGGTLGDSGRGSSALTGDADVVMALAKQEGHKGSLRVISAMSRFEETPSRLVVERRGGVYVDLGDVDVAAGEAELAVLALLSPDPALAVAVGDLLDMAGLKKTAGREALERLVKSGKVVATGAGTRGSPKRYGLPKI
jgi:hypothetical protein